MDGGAWWAAVHPDNTSTVTVHIGIPVFFVIVPLEPIISIA